MVTYVMSATQMALWEQGATTQVQAQVAQAVFEANCVEDVVVALADGQIAYFLCLRWKSLTSAND